jgi:long-subunit acyl-CoA synthetase (AMP-forming)
VDQLVRNVGTKGILVVESHEGNGGWRGMESWSHVLDSFTGDSREALDHDPCVVPEDNATIIFTSGTYVDNST